MSISHKQVKAAVQVVQSFYDFHGVAISSPSTCFAQAQRAAAFLNDGKANPELVDAIFNELQYEQPKK